MKIGVHANHRALILKRDSRISELASRLLPRCFAIEGMSGW